MTVDCGESDDRNRQYWENFSIAEYWRHLLPKVRPIIFDVGANIGQSVLYFEKIFDQPQFFCFEPDSDAVGQLRSFGVKRPNVRIFNIALSNADTVSTFYMQDKSHLSSLKPINLDSTDSLGYAVTAKNSPTLVTMRRLDSFSEDLGLPVPDILKIDVQGSELQVLEGCTGILDNVDVVVVEVSLYDFYGRSTRLDHVIAICHAHDLECWDISKVSKNPKTFGTDWLEVVFKRSNSNQ